jgi:hypothetical protein
VPEPSTGLLVALGLALVARASTRSGHLVVAYALPEPR